MPSSNINHVVITGNLTRDVELKSTSSGTAVTELGVANNANVKDSSGNWVTKPNFFQVVVWARQAENCAQYLSKGSKIAVDGRLEFQQWENAEGKKNSRVVIVANNIEFLNAKGANSKPSEPATGGQDDDIPF